MYTFKYQTHTRTYEHKLSVLILLAVTPHPTQPTKTNHPTTTTTCCVRCVGVIVCRSTDVEDVKFVINYDYPNNSEDYVHRIGRTGRSNNTGTAYTLFTYQNSAKANDLINVLKEANQVGADFICSGWNSNRLRLFAGCQSASVRDGQIGWRLRSLALQS